MCVYRRLLSVSEWEFDDDLFVVQVSAVTAKTATPRTRMRRPSVSDWRPSRRPKIAAKRSIARWKRSARRCDKTSAIR